MANRLSSDSSKKVLLIESGSKKDSALYQAPGLVAVSNSIRLYSTWFKTIPQKYLKNRILEHPRGYGIGGSSLANMFVYDSLVVTHIYYSVWFIFEDTRKTITDGLS